MLPKCGNPTCSACFRRLGSGRLFRFEVRSPSEACRDVPHSVCNTKSGHASVFFWLCENCKLTHTLSFDSARDSRSGQFRPITVLGQLRTALSLHEWLAKPRDFCHCIL